MKVVAVFPKSAIERIEIRFGKYNGRKRLDIRVSILINNEWRPTKKGAPIDVKYLPEFLQIVTAVLNSIDEQRDDHEEC